MTHDRFAAVLFLATLVLGGLVAWQAWAHDPYGGWMQPGTAMSCCHDRDCRPTVAYIGDDGLWRARDGDRWITVPQATVLPVSTPPQDGRCHVCVRNGRVLCFRACEVRA